MANEVEIVIKDRDATGPGVASAEKKMRGVGTAAKQSGEEVEKTQGRFSRFGSTLSSTNRISDATTASWQKMGIGIAGAAVAWAGANKVMNDGIAIGLRSANAQVALGEEYGRLKQAAESQAHSIGMTTSEYEQAAGMTAALAKNMGFATKVAVGFGMLMPDLATKLSVLSNGTRTAAETSDMMRAAIAGEFDPLQTLGINISAAVVEQEKMNIVQQHGKKFTDQQANALAVLNIVQRQTGDASKVMATEQGKAAMAAQKNAAEMRQAWQDLERAAVPVLSAITQYVGDTLGAIVDLKDAITGKKGLAGGFETFINAAVPATNIIDRLFKKTKDQGDASKEAAPKVDDLAKAQQGGAQSAEELAEATEAATDKIKELADIALAASDAEINWEQALDDATASLKENGKTLDITTEKGRTNKKALDDIARAALGQADAVREAGGSETQYRAKLEQSRAALIRAATQFGMTKTQAKAYADQVLGIPRSRQTDIKLNAQQALGTLAYLNGRIRAMDGSVITVYARQVLLDSAARGIATGGIAGSQVPQQAASGGIRSNMVWVGEHGPELMSVPPGSRVHSNPDSQRMVRESGRGGGGSESAPVIVEFRSDDPALLQLMRRMVRVYGGGSTQKAFGDVRLAVS